LPKHASTVTTFIIDEYNCWLIRSLSQRFRRASLKLEFVEGVLVWHAPVIVVCVIRVRTQLLLLRLIQSVVRVLRLLSLGCLSIQVVGLGLVLRRLLNIDALPALEPLVIEVAQELADRVLLARVAVEFGVSALVVAAVVAVLQLAVPQALNFIDLLAAEFFPLLDFELALDIHVLVGLFVLSLLSQVSQLERDLGNLAHVHALRGVARWECESRSAFELHFDETDQQVDVLLVEAALERV